MKIRLFALLPAIVLAVLAMQGVATADNVALNKTVTATSGSVFNGQPLSTVVDGTFLPEQTQWQQDVWWVGTGPSFTIDLGGTFTINQFMIQADDNDTYAVSYWDAGSSSWQLAWAVPYVSSWGLVTRDSGIISPITTNLLAFQATGGDNYYGLSEIQAFGQDAPVPEPTTLLFLGTGLVGLFGLRRKIAK